MTKPIKPADHHFVQPDLCSLETEAALLGAVMIDARTMDRVSEIVTDADFYEPVHGRIFAAVSAACSEGRSTNPFVINNMLGNDATLDELGGMGYLSQLTGNAAVLIGAIDFARDVADFAKRRRLRDSMFALIDDLNCGRDVSVADAVERIDANLHNAMMRTTMTSAVTLCAAFDKTMQAIENEANGLTSKGIAIAGLDDWNVLTGGMRPGEVTVLAARPGMGKTACALSVALGAARNGHGTLLVSLEMTMQELTKRAIADLLFSEMQGPGFENVKAGKFTQPDRQRLNEVRAEIESWPMLITDPAKLRVGQMSMQIRRFQRSMAARGQKLELVVLDYLGLIKADSAKASRYESVGEVSRAIKEVAKECGVSILVLAQLNRECEKREDKRPILSDLRDSGDIEQDADTVIFLHREEYYLSHAEPDPGDMKRRPAWDVDMEAARDRIEIIAAKRRNGKLHKRLCWFFAAHQAVRGSNHYSGVTR